MRRDRASMETSVAREVRTADRLDLLAQHRTNTSWVYGRRLLAFLSSTYTYTRKPWPATSGQLDRATAPPRGCRSNLRALGTVRHRTRSLVCCMRAWTLV